MRQSLLDLKARGRSVLGRFAGLAVPDELLPSLEAFRAAHRAFEDGTAATADSLRASRAAHEEVATLDAALDARVYALADALVGAGLGDRKNPFARFSKHAPGAIACLAYDNGLRAVRALVAKIAKADPPEPVADKLAECLEHAARVQRALVGISVLSFRFKCDRLTRDKLAADWNRAFARLKLRAQLAYEDKPATLATLFAPPGRLERPVTRRRRKGRQLEPAGQPSTPR